MSIDISGRKNNLVRPAPNRVDALPPLRAVSSTLRGVVPYGTPYGTESSRKPACKPMVWKQARSACDTTVVNVLVIEY